MSPETTKLFIIEAVERLARGDEHGIAERILADLDGLTPEQAQSIRDKAVELSQFANGLALDEAKAAPIYRAAREGYDPAKLVIERHRRSTTQGEVTLTYDGKRLDRYGDDIRLKNGEWVGQDDAHWHHAASIVVARRAGRLP